MKAKKSSVSARELPTVEEKGEVTLEKSDLSYLSKAGNSLIFDPAEELDGKKDEEAKIEPLFPDNVS